MKLSLLLPALALLPLHAGFAAEDRTVGTASETQSSVAAPAQPGANPRGNSGTGAAGIADKEPSRAPKGTRADRPRDEYSGATKETERNAGQDSSRPRSPAE